MKRYSLCLGQQIDYQHPHPDRTAKRRGNGIFDDDVFQVWTNRKAMARSIRMQERSDGPSYQHWQPLVKLTDGEGH